jgi:hypothetical protein
MRSDQCQTANLNHRAYWVGRIYYAARARP